MMQLDGFRCLLTGATSDFGHAVALEGGARGVRWVLVDESEAPLDRLADAICEAGGPEPLLLPVALSDVTPELVRQADQSITARLGGLDGIWHVASQFDGLRPLEQVSPEDWLRSVQVNLNTPWLLTTGLLHHLRSSDDGRVLWTFLEPDAAGRSFWGPFGVCAAAQAALVSQWAAETRGSAVKVAGLVPGPHRGSFRQLVFVGEDPTAAPDPAVVADRAFERLQQDDWESGDTLELSESPRSAGRESEPGPAPE